MRTRGRFPRPLPFLVAAVLGAGAVVLPAVAVSETTPTISAVSNESVCGHYYKNCWSPAQATVEAAGGTVFFSNESGVTHGIVWNSVPATPSCSGVPVGAGMWATSFNGKCTFPQAGTYTFYCSYHLTSMSGTVTVNGSGTTTVTTTPTTSSGTNPTPAPITTTGQSGTTAPPAATGAAGSLLAAAASGAVKIAPSQRGKTVQGSVAISPAGAGGRLEVELLAGAATLASAGHSAPVRVGRLVRSNLKSGTASFSVPLNTRARGALRRHGRLALRVKLTLRPVSGSALVISRRVTVHR